MSTLFQPWLTSVILLTLVFTAISAATQTETAVPPNHHGAYTKLLKVSKDGVVTIPSRYSWSVETSQAPDRRIILRLYDPDQPFSVLVSQLNYETAEKLHQDLGHVLAKKKENPDFQHKPKLYPDSMIPKGVFKGIGADGTVEVELIYPDKKAD